ncbi:hypothetical protein [Granulicella tundricola]|uniref:Transporter n=1 Tax=Granulicella tundricola (strain ATCC BAA-1859 / DSM 23138 / MP5ACTX9) TaxID=1198114 RepID=E8X246_GRATM|nr:hypothetical protein [Granulicella tundricola]ADW70289.1 hypothetical protein AciX9_3278 [Granulicella tundricola MP5ACTX9]
MKTSFSSRCVVAVGCVLFSGSFVSTVYAQGCLAAHTSSTIQSCITSGGVNEGAGDGMSFLHKHPLTMEVDWRSFSSFRHFSGEKENFARAAAGLDIENHQNIYSISLDMQVTPRWSVNAFVPVLQGTRDQKYAPVGKFDIAGIGDMIVGVQGWVLKPPAENGGNIAFSLGLKLPTGLNNGMGTAKLANGMVQKVVADQSLQPGDGTWGFTVGAQAYKQTYFHTVGYFQGSWLFNPEDTNGVPTFRASKLEAVMSATDQYLFRAGLSRHVPRVHGLAASFGGRMEGIPVRDAFGKSDGFRRPGYIISIEPAVQYQHHHDMISLTAPWAIQRNRRASVTDLASGTHGDAAFADYAIILSASHTF